MTERRSRVERAEAPPPLVLTMRDEAIVLACWEHRWLTREQLRRLLPLPGVGRTNDRLRRLYDAGFLQRLRAGTVGAGLQPVYVAGEAAVPLLAARTGRPERAIRNQVREAATASAVLLPHDLQVNDLRIALTRALERTPGVTFDLWLHAGDCYDAYTSSRILRPDGYFRFWRAEQLAACFVEVDRGTTSLARWRTKVERYVEYREAGHYTRRYDLTRYRVLTTVPSRTRLEQLRETTARVTPRSFWFALHDSLVDSADPTRPCWIPVGGDRARALIEEGRER